MTNSARTHSVTSTANNTLEIEALQTTQQVVIPSFSSATNFALNHIPTSIDVGDFNSDGWLDLATGTQLDILPNPANAPAVSVLLNNRAGGFNAPINLRVADVWEAIFPRFMAVGDFNGDRLPDVATSNYPVGFSLLLNNGSADFNPAINLNGGGRPVLFGVGDFNGDGLSDLVSGSYGNSTVQVYLNNGNNGFNPPTSYQAGLFPNAVVIADFNNDGSLDLAVKSALPVPNVSVNPGISLLLNNGTGGFNPGTSFAVGRSLGFIAAGDFNNDGWIDLVATNTSPGNVSVLLNNKTGGFNEAINFQVGGNLGSIAVGDINGDGNLDVVTGNDTGFNLVLGDGTGTFNNVTNVELGTRPGPLVLRDFNNDGKLDIAATGNLSVNVLLNTTNFPPVNIVPGAQLNQQNTPLIFSSANGNQISVKDVDAGNNSEKVTLSATNGTLTLNGISGLCFLTGDGTNDSTMTFTGSLSSINDALNGLQFNPNANYTGPASLTITSNDQSAGGGLSDTDAIAITVAILGTAGDDTLFGTNRDDTIYGLAGNDTIFGKPGVNTIDGGEGDDVIFGGKQADIIYGGNGNDLIFARGGNNQVFGDAGDDSIYTGSGNNLINGGAGSDRIWLGGGEDQVVIAKGNGADTIYNFQLGQTRIALADGLQFSDLTITQGENGALIQAGNELLARLSFVSASGINSSSFVSV